MRAIDAACPALGVSTHSLMENAGRAVADAIAARFTPRPIAVLCGPGNNGGDGYVAARLLAERGWPVTVHALAPRKALTGDAADAARAWTGALTALGDAPLEAELYLDALFGAGLSRPLEGHAARLAQTLAPERVVAVDVPSGLGGDAGKPLGDACFRAGLTVTFVCKKPAHVLAPGRGLCGEIVLAHIGAPAAAVAAQNIALWENDPAHWALPWPVHDAHKHARGHVMVASGPHMRSGAARLAARAALRIGAGLVTVLSPPDALTENAAQLTAIMLREVASPQRLVDAVADAGALVIGPAFGVDARAGGVLATALMKRERCPFVLDADALTLSAPIEQPLFSPRDVLTPHVGEFERLFPGLLEASPSRIEAAREAATRSGAVVLLKGPDTVIAAPDGRAIINTSGTPFLATAGAGDVLAGMIAGLIGQGMPSFEAAAAAAWLHGKAGEALGPGLIAEDLTERLPDLLNALAPPGLRRRSPS
jgi:ADP-dependent NAD(P)H-hydrate dehydratase / NAD(P)H-hydrate epimerase